jgi:hypothetical protein
MKLSQKGFGTKEGLLVIIALILVIGTGFYVIKNGDDNQDLQTTGSTESGYLDIEEFGIKVPMDETLKGVTYSVPQGGEVALSSEQLAPLVDACFPGQEIPGGDKGTFLSVVKVDGQYTQKPDSEKIFLKQFDTFYLSAGEIGTGCGGSTDATAERQYSEKSNELYQAGIAAFKDAEKL